jgi:hypothetical protein
MPAPSDPEFADDARELLTRVERHDVRCIVVEGDATRMRFSAADLPGLPSRLASEWTHTKTFGPVRLYER